MVLSAMSIELNQGTVLAEKTPYGQVQATLEVGFDAFHEYGYTLEFHLVLDGGKEPLRVRRGGDIDISSEDLKKADTDTKALYKKLLRAKVEEKFNAVVAAMSEPMREIPLGLNLPHSNIIYKIRKWRLEQGI